MRFSVLNEFFFINDLWLYFSHHEYCLPKYIWLMVFSPHLIEEIIIILSFLSMFYKHNKIYFRLKANICCVNRVNTTNVCLVWNKCKCKHTIHIFSCFRWMAYKVTKWKLDQSVYAANPLLIAHFHSIYMISI